MYVGVLKVYEYWLNTGVTGLRLLKNCVISLIIVFVIVFVMTVEAQESENLPEPLTLKAAIETASNLKHPVLRDISLRYEKVQAQINKSASNNDFRIDFEGRIREVEPSDKADSDQTGDSAASLILSKPLYDFGLSDTVERQLKLHLSALDAERDYVIQQRELKILQNYFEVLDADNRFITENENLAIAFIRYDNARENQILGSVAEIDVLRLQANYEKARQLRYLAEHKQRYTREVLALSMGYPDQISSQLEQPEIYVNTKYEIEMEQLIEASMINSLELIWREMQAVVAKQSIDAASKSDNGGIDFEFEVSEYERETSTRDEWRATIYLNLPIFSTNEAAKIDIAHADYENTLNDLLMVKLQVRLKILELWQKLNQAQLVAQGFAVEESYRELYLDKSRAEYELEFKTDLGDAMVEFSRSRTQRLAAEYQFELARRHLTMLVGEEVFRSNAN